MWGCLLFYLFSPPLFGGDFYGKEIYLTNHFTQWYTYAILKVELWYIHSRKLMAERSQRSAYENARLQTKRAHDGSLHQEALGDD